MVALDGISASSRRPTKKETDLTHDEVLGFFLHREYFAFSGEREKSLGENGAQQFSCELVVQPLTHSRWYVPYSIVKQPRPFSVVYSSKSKRSEKWYKNCVHISVVLSSGNIRIGFSAKSTILYPHGPRQQLVRNFSVIEKVLRVFCPFCNSRPKKCVGFLTFSKKCCIFRTFQKSSLPFIKWVALSYQYHQDRAQHNVLVSPVSSNKSYKVLFKVSNRKMWDHRVTLPSLYGAGGSKFLHRDLGFNLLF